MYSVEIVLKENERGKPLKKSVRALMTGILLLLLLALTGCINRVVLHPISQQDIIEVDKGEVFTAPKDGYFLSDLYLKRVAKAQVN